MPVSYRSGGVSSERTYQIFMDWTRRIMQLAALATVILYAYLFYGLFVTAGQWGTLFPPEQQRIATNISGAVVYLNLALGIFLLTVSILYYDEEPTGYTLVAISVLFYYGLPFLIDQFMGGKLQEWTTTKNVVALSILGQFKIAAIMMAVPGGILLARDIFVRLVDGAQRSSERTSGMQYGGSVKEEEPVGGALIGMFAKCWQLPYCRDAIRKRCPIFHARTRCWRQRVGCMCEENVIRHAMDAIINKQIISFEKPSEPVRKPNISDVLIEGLGGVESEEPEAEPALERTEEYSKPIPAPKVDSRHVKIPHNTSISMAAKKERCRNCVIYNEHQRLKYQFFAPVVVLAVPLLAYFKIEIISDKLHTALKAVDSVMARLSLDPNAKNAGIAQSITSSSKFAEYMVIGCMIVIAVTMSIRFLEYCIFKLKI